MSGLSGVWEDIISGLDLDEVPKMDEVVSSEALNFVEGAQNNEEIVLMGVNNVEAVDPESLLNEVDVNAMPEFGDIGVKECLNHDVGNVDGEEYRREFFNCDEVRACLELLVRKM